MIASPAVFLAGVFLWARAGKYSAIRIERERALRSEFSSVQGWIVDLMIRQGHTPTGRDRGLAWFEGERLYFSGERTSFGLSRSQVAGFVDYDHAIEGLRLSLEIQLHATTPAGPVAVDFDLMPPLEATTADTPRAPFVSAIKGWLAKAAGDDEGQLPPLTLGPEVLNRPALLRSATISTAAWTLILAGFIWGGLYQDWVGSLAVTMIVVGALFSWSHLWYPRFLWQALRDRKRLDKASQ